MTPAPKSPIISYPPNLALPIPVVKTKSAPTELVTPSPHMTHFYWPGTDALRQQDEDDDTLIQQIRIKSPIVLRKGHASRHIGSNTILTLPDSLLLKIFNLSVHVAGAVDIYNTEDIHHFTRLHAWDAGHPDFAVSRHTGYSLMRLSKFWHSAACKYPFRYVRIRSSKQLAIFAKLLKERAHCNGGYHAPGEWVQRLDLMVSTGWEWKREDAQMLHGVFTMCPNITCFSTIGSTAAPSKFGLPALLANISRIAPRLRRLELAADHHVLGALHNNHSDRVEILWITSAATMVENRNNIVHSFPGVRALFAARETESWVRYFSMPSLTAVLMDDSGVGGIPVMERSKLEHISLTDTWNLTQFNDFIELKSVSFDYSEISHRKINWPQEISASQVSCVTIYAMSTGWNNIESSRVLKDNFLLLISEQNFPDLKRIRFLVAVDNAGEPQLPSAMKGFWKNLVAICNVMGRAIEVIPDGRCTRLHVISPNSML